MADERDRRRVLAVYGTRPEAIKLAPALERIAGSQRLTAAVAVTGQHRTMLDQVNHLFGIEPDYDLNLIEPRQTLTAITTKALAGLQHVIEDCRPDAVLVQGDTTTTFTGALAAFYNHVPVFHLEAGLRTNDIASPFPEELNRRLTSQLTALHFAATPRARDNLLLEGVKPEQIVVTGNTVIDALLGIAPQALPYDDPRLESVDTDPRRVVLVTAHRRESWGAGMASIGRAVRRIASMFADVIVVLPLHRNPVVRETLQPLLNDLHNVVLTEPQSYGAFCRLMARAHVLLTDSGGVQEEGPSLGKPVLVMRETTERPEAIDAGTAMLVGRDEDRIVEAVSELLTDGARYAEMANAVNPYGDGRAACRVVAAVEHFFGFGPPPGEFVP